MTFNRSKQRGPKKSSTFLVPRLTKNPREPDPCKILDLYLQELKHWVPNVKPENELFYQGYGPNRKNNVKEKSRFANQYLGLNTMRKVPEFIAEYLGKPNSKAYTGIYLFLKHSVCVSNY